MAYLDTWRKVLKDNLKIFAPLSRNDASIDKIFGLIGATVLWAIRDKTPEQLESLNAICQNDAHQAILLDALEGWKKRTPDEALQELDREQKSNPALQEAIKTLLNYFLEDLFSDNILKIDISGNISGGNVIIGSRQVVLGDLTIQYIMPKAERLCPTPNEEPTQFGGRDKEFDELVTALKSGENCAITALNAAGGMGKTTIAKVLASCLYKDKTFRSVLWADVTRNPNYTTLISGWAQYADSAFQPKDMNEAQLARHVKSLLDELIQEQCEQCEPSRVLMVLDDVWANGISIARLLMQARPENTTILITTRDEKLTNDLQVTHKKSLSRMQINEAAQLLAEYLPQAEKDSLKRLGLALGGHPLAMELASRRVKNEEGRTGKLSDALANCINDYERGIPAGTQFAELKLEHGEEKDDNLTKSLFYSYESLNPEKNPHSERQARFRVLGTLAYDEPFDTTLLERLWQAENQQQTLAFCDELRLFSLIESVPNQVGWYRQHPLLRSYARALLSESEHNEAFNRYADHITQIAIGFRILPLEAWGQLDPFLPHVDFVGDELARLWADESQRDDDLTQRAGDFSLSIRNYVYCRPLAIQREGQTVMRGMNWLEMGLSVSKARDDKSGEATTLNNIGLAWDALGDKRKALDFYNQALPLSREVGDKSGEARTLNNIGGAWDALGDKRKALDFYNQALPLFSEVGDKSGEATTLNNIGHTWDALGDKRKALDFYNQALPLRREVGDKSGEATTLNNIGHTWDALGDKRKALDFYNQALPLSREVGDKSGEATTLNNIGHTWDALGDKRKALDFYNQALPLFSEVGDKSGEATTLNNIGHTWDALGDKRKALDFYNQALPLFSEVGDKSGEATTLNNIGHTWDALGDKRKALDFYNQALPLRREVGDKSGEAVTCFNMGIIFANEGNLDKAIEFIERTVALDIEVEHPDLESDRQTLEQLKAMRDGGNKTSRANSNEGISEETLRALVGIYQQSGEEGLRAVLRQNNIPDEAIDTLMMMIKANAGSSDTAQTTPQNSASATLSAEVVNNWCQNTVAVKTGVPEKRDEWLDAVQNMRVDIASKGDDWAQEVVFIDAIIAILDDNPIILTDENPYSNVVKQVQDAIEQFRKG